MLRRQKHALSESTTPFACTLARLNSSVFKQPPEGPFTEDRSTRESHPDHGRVFWVHANGGIINGGVACVCAKGRVFVQLCAFLRFFVRFCAFCPAKMACRKAQNCA